MTLRFEPPLSGRRDVAGGWEFSRGDGSVTTAWFRRIGGSTTDPTEAVALSLETAFISPDCDMLLNARISGSQMRGTILSGRCERRGEQAAEVTLRRR